MSASILWEPVDDKYLSLPVSAPSSFIEVMDKVFGHYPWILTRGSIAQLEAMSAMFNQDQEDPFKEAIEVIEKFGKVKVWPEW